MLLSGLDLSVPGDFPADRVSGKLSRGGAIFRLSPFPCLVLLVILVFAPLSAAVAAGDAEDARALMRRIDALWRGNSAQATITMAVTTRRYSRTITMESWSQGKDQALLKILAPKKDRGIATLRVDKNIWNFLPKINRVTKIPPSMMMGSWMGSHFTNDDLVKESSYEEDYTSSITFNGEREGRGIYEVTALPREDAVVVWGKVVMEIEKERLIPIRALYYDEDGDLAREMRFEDPRPVGDRIVPLRLVLTPSDKPGESTTVTYESIRFDVKIPGGLFSLRGLRNQ